MTTSTWAPLFKELATPGLAILSFVIGSLQKKGEQSAILKTLAEAVTDLKATVIQHSKMLERHQVLHEGGIEGLTRADAKLERYTEIVYAKLDRHTELLYELKGIIDALK